MAALCLLANMPEPRGYSFNNYSTHHQTSRKRCFKDFGMDTSQLYSALTEECPISGHQTTSASPAHRNPKTRWVGPSAFLVGDTSIAEKSSGITSGGRSDDRDDKDNHNNNDGNEGGLIKTLNSRLKFACPFQKIDPVRWSFCSHRGFASVSRTKDHIIHAHNIIICKSCLSIYDSHADLNRHIRENQHDHSYNENKKRLWKDARNEWFQLYTVLFPGEPVPTSPCQSNHSIS